MSQYHSNRRLVGVHSPASQPEALVVPRNRLHDLIERDRTHPLRMRLAACCRRLAYLLSPSRRKPAKPRISGIIQQISYLRLTEFFNGSANDGFVVPIPSTSLQEPASDASDESKRLLTSQFEECPFANPRAIGNRLTFHEVVKAGLEFAVTCLGILERHIAQLIGIPLHGYMPNGLKNWPSKTLHGSD